MAKPKGAARAAALKPVPSKEDSGPSENDVDEEIASLKVELEDRISKLEAKKQKKTKNNKEPGVLPQIVVIPMQDGNLSVQWPNIEAFSVPSLLRKAARIVEEKLGV